MNSIYNLQQGRAKLDKLQETVALGSNINRPSDNPIGSSMLLSISDQLKAGEHHASNISKANTFLQVTSTALQGMADTMQLAKQLMANISSGSNDQTELANTVSQLQALKQQMVDMGNTQVGNQYVFGGANNQIKPFRAGDIGIAATSVTNVDTTGLVDGMTVSGSGIPPNTIIKITNNGTAGAFDLYDSTTNSLIATPPGTSNTSALSAASLYFGDNTQLKVETSTGNSQKLNIPGNQVLLGTVLITGDISNDSNNNNIIDNVNIPGLSSGMELSGTGIPAGTKIGIVTQPTSTIPGSFTLVDANGDPVSGINITPNASITISLPYGTTNILQTFDDLIDAVKNNRVATVTGPPVLPGIQAGAQALEAGAGQITRAQTDVASWMTRLDSASKMNTNSKTTLETIVSNTQNVDYAKLAVELTQQQTAFQASLSATAKVTQLSLLDYMQ